MTIDPIFRENGSTLYFSRNEEDEGVPFCEEISKVAEDILLKGKTLEGREKVWAVPRDRFFQWAERSSCTLLQAKGIYTLVREVKQEIAETFFEPKSKEEAIAILGFDPMNLDERWRIRNACFDREKILEILKQYSIKTKEGRWARFEIAKIAARENVDAFGITGAGTSCIIHHFGFNPKSAEGHYALLVIAKIDAAKDPSGTSEYIQNYGFDPGTKEGRRALLEIALISASKDGWKTSKFIRLYGFSPKTEEGQDALFKVAKQSAACNGWGTSEYIQNYGFDPKEQSGRQALLEIAKIAAKNNGKGTSEYIQNYGFDPKTDEGHEALLEIGKIAVTQNGETLEHLQNYGFDLKEKKGLKALVEIATIVASKWHISRYIQKFGFNINVKDHRKVLLKLAKIAAAKDGWDVSINIQLYGFNPKTDEGKDALLEVAKIAATVDGTGTSIYIQNYGFDPKKKRGRQAHLEIAKNSALRSGGGTSEYIKNYGFDPKTEDGLNALFEIAKIAAANDGGFTSKYILNYGFDQNKHHQRLLEIAKIAAAQNGVGISYNIQNYRFDPKTDQGRHALSEILCIAASQNLYASPSNVRGYHIDDQDVLDKVLKMIFEKKVAAEKDQFPDKDWFDLLFEGFPKYFSNSSNRYEFVKRILNQMSQEALCWVERCFSKEKSEQNKNQLINWLIPIVLYQLAFPKLNLLKDKDKSLWLLEEMEKRDNQLRKLLTEDLLSASLEGRLEKLKDSLGDETKERPLRLMRLVLSHYPEEAKTTCERALQTFNRSKSRVALKDGAKQKLILETLFLIRNTSLSPQTKGEYVAWLAKLPKKPQQEAASLIKDILLFGGEKDLKATPEITVLKKNLEGRFKMSYGLTIEGFSEKYTKTIAEWRKREAIFTYGAGLKTLDDKGVAKELFSMFLTFVLENTFEKQRTSLDQNPHLKAIAENHPDVFAKWNTSVSLSSFEMGITENKESVRDRIFNQLQMAVKNKHLGEDQEAKYPHFIAAIRKEKTMEQALMQVTLRLKNDQHSSLNQEKVLLQLLIFGDDKNEIKNQMLKTLSEEMENTLFKEDLLACRNFLEDVFERESLQVIDSTDPNHFLLMGTEVSGSCQRVGGNPKLNKGLLGYMLDGKHRLFLVLDASGRILARSVARLLVDEKDQPVLFQELLYIAEYNHKYFSFIRKLAQKKAKEMNVPLVVGIDDPSAYSMPRYAASLKALQGSVPFEYVDALGGIQKTPYTILEALVINS